MSERPTGGTPAGQAAVRPTRERERGKTEKKDKECDPLRNAAMHGATRVEDDGPWRKISRRRHSLENDLQEASRTGEGSPGGVMD